MSDDELTDRLVDESYSRYRNVDIAYETTVTIPNDVIDAFRERRQENARDDVEIGRRSVAEALAQTVAKKDFRDDFDVVGTPTVAVQRVDPYPPEETKINLLVKH